MNNPHKRESLCGISTSICTLFMLLSIFVRLYGSILSCRICSYSSCRYLLPALMFSHFVPSMSHVSEQLHYSSFPFLHLRYYERRSSLCRHNILVSIILQDLYHPRHPQAGVLFFTYIFKDSSSQSLNTYFIRKTYQAY